MCGFKKKLFPEEIEIFIRENASGLFNADLTDLVNKTFNTDYTIVQIKGYKQRNHISSGITSYFLKGQVPFNKGKKMSEELYKKCAPTMFKKGNIPCNHRPIGSERLSKDGYLQIKVAEPNVWRAKHVAVWEKHNGKVPKGHNIIFLDRNTRNFDINNLVCVSKAQMVRLNQNHRISEFPEITKAGIALEKFKAEIVKKRKEKKCT